MKLFYEISKNDIYIETCTSWKILRRQCREFYAPTPRNSTSLTYVYIDTKSYCVTYARYVGKISKKWSTTRPYKKILRQSHLLLFRKLFKYNEDYIETDKRIFFLHCQMQSAIWWTLKFFERISIVLFHASLNLYSLDYLDIQNEKRE